MAKKKSGINAVVLGGGTGTFTVLSSLKHYVPNITAVVNMVDDGGSTGFLRDELGALPPGDVRQCLVALSKSSEVMRELMNYRFGGGTFEGHSFGNLFLTALEKITGSFDAAVKMAGEILSITGRVVPVTTADIRLGLKLRSGKVLVGEKTITQSFFNVGERPKLFLKPKARINPDAAEAIRDAHLIIVGPGNLYSSLIPTVLVGGVGKALRESKAKKVYISNLVTKPGQTDGFMVHDFVDEIEKYTGGPTFDFVLYNTEKPSAELLERYAAEGEQWVLADSSVMKDMHYEPVAANLVSRQVTKQNPNDKFIRRTLIRHDSDKLARLLMRLYFS